MNVGVFTTGDQEGGHNDRIGLRDGDHVIDVTTAVGSFDAALQRLADGTSLPTDGERIDRERVQWLPPARPKNNTFAVALNYGSHIAEKSESDAIDEQDRAVPETPYFFLKLQRSLVGHRESIQWPSDISEGLDYAAELGVVVGKPARNVSPDEALECVAGYTIVNDTAAYDVQNVAVGEMTWIDWLSAKSMEASTPMGPAVTPRADISDPHALSITSSVNGERMQDGSTGSMIRGIEEQLSFLSTRFTLQPGDVIATGTPEGVGAFQNLSLEHGDQVEITIEGVGTLSNTVEDVDR